MKVYFKNMFKISLALSLFCATTSCTDYLERTPDAVISEEVAFRNFRNFQGYTEELYSCVPNFTLTNWTSSWNWGEDEIVSIANNDAPVNGLDRGDFFAWQVNWGPSWLNFNSVQTGSGSKNKGLWPLAWYGIRKANIGLANLDLLTEATDEEKKLIEGQLLFFRAWFHFQLIEHFGGMPYIDKVLPSDQPLREPRLSYQACAEKAAADFRRAADLLPINWDNTVAGGPTLNKNRMRINKIMALGYLGKNLLWAGSPLMNKESTGSGTYNQDYCKRAAEAFGELLNLVETGQTQFALLPFSNIQLNFYTRGQNWLLPGGTEVIFQGPYYSANDSNWYISKQYLPSALNNEASTYVPTSNYVNYYGMANGMPLPEDISQPDTASGYDPEYPFKGRDPRFYKDIIFDGLRIVTGSIPVAEESLRYANLFTGGNYRDVRTGSRTGYCLRKFIPLVANRFDQGNSYGNALHINIPYMRLADIYLMYAESALMGYNTPAAKSSNFSKTAIEAVNVIRNRATMPNVLQQFTGSVTTFLPELRRERAVELSFEKHRFNDLRRWLLLTERPYTYKKSLEFNRAPGTFNTTDPTLNKVVNLREEIILERNYGERHYWLPLIQRDVTLYPEFKQNPGW